MGICFHLLESIFFAVLWTSPHRQLTSIMIIEGEWWEKNHRRRHHHGDHYHDRRRHHHHDRHHRHHHDHHHDHDYDHPAISGMSATRPGPAAINFRARSAPCLGVGWHILSKIMNIFSHIILPGSRLAYHQRHILSTIMRILFSHSLKNRSIEIKQVLYLQLLIL